MRSLGANVGAIRANDFSRQANGCGQAAGDDASWRTDPDNANDWQVSPDDSLAMARCCCRAGFAIDSFPDVHAAMTAAGIEFIYPEPQRAGGRAWQHFRGPDGNIYEVIGPDDQGT
jgi:hypothetical protein